MKQGVDWKYALREADHGARRVGPEPSVEAHVATPRELGRLSRAAPPTPTTSGTSKKRLYDATKSGQEPYGAPAETVLPPLFVSLTDQQEFNELRTTINEFMRENIALFVTGKLVSGVRVVRLLGRAGKIGIDRYLELVQSTYDRDYQ